MSVFDSLSPVASPFVVDRDWSRLNTTELRRVYGTATVATILHDAPTAPVSPSPPAAVSLAPEQPARPVEVEAQEPSTYSAIRNAERQRQTVEVARLPAGDIRLARPLEHEAASAVPRGDAVGRGASKPPAVLPYGFDATRLAELIDVIIDGRGGVASLRATREAGDLTAVDPDVASRPSEEIVQPVRPSF